MKAKEDLYKDPIRAFLVKYDAEAVILYDLKMELRQKEEAITAHIINYRRMFLDEDDMHSHNFSRKENINLDKIEESDHSYTSSPK